MNEPQRIKFLYRIIDERAGADQPPLLAVSIHHGVVRRDTITDDLPRAEDLSNYKLCEPGDIVLNRMRAFQGAIGISPQRGIVSPDYLVLRPGSDVDAHYLHHLFRSSWFVGEMVSRLRGIGNTENGAVRTPRINPEDLGDISVVLPTRNEQYRIAHFLDTEAARIDSLIRRRTQSITLLNERLSATIDRLVRGEGATRRVQADYKPLGLIPADWHQGRLRNLDCEVQTGPFGSQLHAADYVEDGWPVVNPANITSRGLVADRLMTVSDRTRDRLSRYRLEPGDVVFGRRGELGRAAIVTESECGWLCGTGSLRVRFSNRAFNPAYLHRFLTIRAIRHYFELYSVGSTMANLNSSILQNVPLLFPDLGEQSRIAEACAEVEADNARIVRLYEGQRDLLAERRQALVTAAVTGQLDVATARSTVPPGGN